ncbi:two-component system chemotaxis response regulator CheY [Motilibacter peucedani]|uniref:Two-component system chemotaxis response regulator CheY n=1 Tax=Motilibacter peucedani TaxID=598650 RepID=A0A420XU57_9ACTN|nr:response regulator [Motilibacter peucedani]RKS80189.1 two-component system chemotaxis response regulator CheY [Motilibacter peucedani]
MRALVIDDSRAMRTILGRILAAQGFTVSDAGNGQEALDVLATLQAEDDLPALALVDWNMPVMDGLTFIKEARSRSELSNLTLMMVTTESEHAQIVRALAAGAHEYVIKPFTADAIADKLALLGLNPTAVSA